MGTNYYLIEKPSLIGRLEGKESSTRHIGKSSGGWCFSLKVYPRENINNLRDWARLFLKGSSEIFDEYDRLVLFEEMISIITKRSNKTPFDKSANIQGYRSLENFYYMNGAQPGPNNLLRHKIADGHCIGHGVGTYDYIVGEFS